MSKKIKVGFIGAGTVGQMHISHWSKLSNCEIVAIADLRPQLLKQAAQKFNIPLTYESHSELLKNPDIEAVAVVTRRHNTAPVVYDCLCENRHVFSEKPMAKTATQAHQLVNAATSRNRIYAVGYQRRHDAGTQIAKKLFDEIRSTEELGQITFVRCWNFTGQDRNQSEDFVMTPEERPAGEQWDQSPEWLPEKLHQAYDRFVNVCSHDLNILRYFFGSTPHISYANLENLAGWLVAFEINKIPGSFTGGFAELNDWDSRGPWDEGLEIYFEKGRLLIKFAPPLMRQLSTRVELLRFNGKDEVLASGTQQTPAFELQGTSFLDDVIENREPLASGIDAAQDLELAETIWQCYVGNNKVLNGQRS